MSGDSISEALAAIREGRLDKKIEHELRSMIDLLSRWGHAFSEDRQAVPAIQAIENEQHRRQRERGQEGLNAKLQAMMDQERELHQQTLDRHKELKVAVDGLRKPHWTLTPTFWISLGILVASVAILIVALSSWLWPLDKQSPPSGISSLSIPYFAATPTNLPPAPTPTQQVSPHESYAPATNNQSTN
jgi:hypothetical protein